MILRPANPINWRRGYPWWCLRERPLSPSFLCSFIVGSAQAADYLIFVASPPLWVPEQQSGPAYRTIEPRVVSSIDNRLVCEADDPRHEGILSDDEDGWVCKSVAIGAGRHTVGVVAKLPNGKQIRLQKIVDLRPQDKKFEFPEKPAQGDQFWCVTVNTTSIALMPKSDPRCHTD